MNINKIIFHLQCPLLARKRENLNSNEVKKLEKGQNKYRVAPNTRRQKSGNILILDILVPGNVMALSWKYLAKWPENQNILTRFIMVSQNGRPFCIKQVSETEFLLQNSGTMWNLKSEIWQPDKLLQFEYQSSLVFGSPLLFYHTQETLNRSERAIVKALLIKKFGYRNLGAPC